MYCIKCGVELADSEKVCPLCGTRVFHPDLPQAQGEPPYPPQEQARPEEVSHTGALFVLTVLLALPAVLSILCDWRVNGRIVWSGYSVGGAALLLALDLRGRGPAGLTLAVLLGLGLAALIVLLLMYFGNN